MKRKLTFVLIVLVITCFQSFSQNKSSGEVKENGNTPISAIAAKSSLAGNSPQEEVISKQEVPDDLPGNNYNVVDLKEVDKSQAIDFKKMDVSDHRIIKFHPKGKEHLKTEIKTKETNK